MYKAGGGQTDIYETIKDLHKFDDDFGIVDSCTDCLVQQIGFIDRVVGSSSAVSSCVTSLPINPQPENITDLSTLPIEKVDPKNRCDLCNNKAIDNIKQLRYLVKKIPQNRPGIKLMNCSESYTTMLQLSEAETAVCCECIKSTCFFCDRVDSSYITIDLKQCSVGDSTYYSESNRSNKSTININLLLETAGRRYECVDIPIDKFNIITNLFADYAFQNCCISCLFSNEHCFRSTPIIHLAEELVKLKAELASYVKNNNN